MKRVVKMDQILQGTNKQDGLTVLALLECGLVAIHEAFPGASVAYLKSDNAGCYHLTTMTLGIALLNAVRVASVIINCRLKYNNPITYTLLSPLLQFVI